MRFWCISDSHNLHAQLLPPKDVSGIIVAGDITNSRFLDKSKEELDSFIGWLKDLPYTHKIVVAGNHDTVLAYWGKEESEKWFKEKADAIYLQDSSVVINDKLIYGSPWTPNYGSWSFMMNDNKLFIKWGYIPKETSVLITHGPPKGILDLSYSPDNKLEYCGDKNLLNRVKTLDNLQYHIFGHIHNNEDCYNQGTRTHDKMPTKFCNVSVITDRKFDKGPSSNGVIIEI